MTVVTRDQRNHTRNAERTQGGAKPRTHSCVHGLFFLTHTPTLPHERLLSCAHSSASHQANRGLVLPRG